MVEFLLILEAGEEVGRLTSLMLDALGGGREVAVLMRLLGLASLLIPSRTVDSGRPPCNKLLRISIVFISPEEEEADDEEYRFGACRLLFSMLLLLLLLLCFAAAFVDGGAGKDRVFHSGSAEEEEEVSFSSSRSSVLIPPAKSTLAFLLLLLLFILGEGRGGSVPDAKDCKYC